MILLENFKSKIVLLKETKFWYLFLRFIFIPIFDFIWKFIINFQGKILYYLYNLKKRNYHNLHKNDKLLVKNNSNFISIAQDIDNAIDDNLIAELKNELLNKIETDPKKNQFGNYKISLYDRFNDDLKDKIINFALSEENIATAANYLKVLPIIGKITVYLNIPSEKQKGSMFWHKDDFGYKSLDIFMTIRDLDAENGPLYFVKPKHPLGVFFKVKDVIKNAKPGERNKIKIENFRKYYTDDQTSSLEGKPGDSVFIDSFSVYHRGGYCNSKNRIMFRISYQTPEASRVQSINHKYGNYFHNKIKEKEVKNIFNKYILFKKINKLYQFLNMPELLVSIIKLVHFKK